MTEHDAGYRALFSDKQMVADLLRGFVREPWVQELDLDTLEQVSASFVSERFQKREGDVIWRVRFRGQWLYVYLLIEFQSTVDRYMALRLMVYVGLLYQRLIEEKQLAEDGKLPPVLPIVLYNGDRRWNAALEVSELLADCPEELKRYRPQMRYFLLDEQAQDDATLAGMKNLAALVFRFEKCRTREEFLDVIDAVRQWAEAPEHQETARRLARWVAMILFPERSEGGEPALDLDDLTESGTMLKERVKQWAQELREEGKAEGWQEGKAEGEAEVLLEQLQVAFGSVPEKFRRLIDEADSAQLLIWAKRLLTAKKIEDVFQD